ncbi:MAG: hypothetical protein IKF36_03020 [Bacilli bacterium]|nr:hypothetical protein [Bacilli bacterium]
MNTELREEYDTLQEILVKLYTLLEDAKEKEKSEDSVRVIMESIESVKKDEKELLQRIRKSIYSKYSVKDIEVYAKIQEKKRIKKEEIEKQKEQAIRIKEFEDAKIVFDGEYKLVYCNGTKVISKRLDRQLLDKNIDFAYDYNICNFLRAIDDENGTSLYRKYRYGQLEVIYDFYSPKKLDRKVIKQMKKVSKESSARNEKVTVVGIKKRTIRGVLATTAVAAMVGLSTLGITSMFKKSDKSNTTKSTYSVSNEDIKELANEEAIVQDTEVVVLKVQSSVKTKVNENAIVKDQETIVNKTQESVKKKVIAKEEIPEVKEETTMVEDKTIDNEFYGLQIGSTMELPDMDLYVSSTSDEAVGNTKYLRAHTGIYKIDLISIVYKGRCLEVLKNQGDNLDELKKYVKETYGDDIKISVNLDVVNEDGKTIYKNVGWVDSDIFSKKSNVKSLVMD